MRLFSLPLMRAFLQIMRQVFVNQVIKMVFAKNHKVIEAFGVYRENETLREGIQVACPRANGHDLDSGGLENGVELEDSCMCAPIPFQKWDGSPEGERSVVYHYGADSTRLTEEEFLSADSRDFEGNPVRPPYQWLGRELPVETELQFNRVRHFDPTPGRWLSADPLGFDDGEEHCYPYPSRIVARDE